jgi:hypothetical protein
MSLFCRLFYNFGFEDKTSIILKDMFKLLLFTQQKWKKTKQNETSIKRKKKKGFVGVFKI